MSRKWQAVKRWDDENLRGWKSPIRWLLRAFSSITLAVALLVFVSLYAVLASVPVGLLALAPTFAFYGVTLLGSAFIVALSGTALVRALSRRAGRGVRFTLTLFSLIALSGAGWWLWQSFVWPSLRYDAHTGEGVRFFRDFVTTYEATTLRRLPGLEMTEQQFYAWWPLQVALALFVFNLIVATIRRIEFCFKNLGVLTVHTGIVLIAMGSLFYGRLKQEGDTILLASQAPAGHAAGDVPGPLQNAFYDRERPVLYIMQTSDVGGARRTGGQFGHLPYEQRPLSFLPRYNDYNLDAGAGDAETLWGLTGVTEQWGDIPTRAFERDVPDGRTGLIDEDVTFRVVGYASYAEARDDVVRADPDPSGQIPAGFESNPVRFLELTLRPPEGEADRPPVRFALFPADPANRTFDNGVFGVEYTTGMDSARWSALSARVPAGTQEALVVEVPRQEGGALREVVPIVRGVSRAIGDTGFSVRVKDVLPQPPFPIITEGYEGAASSVAIVEISRTLPDGTAETYDRWVYHRFPEISQDLLAETDPKTGRPGRRDADPSIRVTLIDCSQLQVYLDEGEDGDVRAIVREPRGGVRVIDRVEPGATIRDIVPRVDLALADRWAHGRPFERPVPVPLGDRRKDQVGTHQRAMVAIEVSAGDETRVVWLPFARYTHLSNENERVVTLRDGRRFRLTFGRRWQQFPGFAVALVDFEMIAYDHRGAPRDYQSVVRVVPTNAGGRQLDFEPYEHVTKLNAPLRAPFHWDPDASWISNFTKRLLGGLSPNQYKLSQAGWDQDGWAQSQQMVDQGVLEEPRARFTILGVGNNPGIHVIALGGILMGVGIPWAFYVKPWLVRREKKRLAECAAATVSKRTRARESAPEQEPAPQPAGAEA